MYNKTIIRFGFCDIQNDQGLGKGIIKVFRIDAPYGCISSFIKHYMKMTTRLPFSSAIYSLDEVTGGNVKGRHIKGVPATMVYKRVRGWTSERYTPPQELVLTLMLRRSY